MAATAPSNNRRSERIPANLQMRLLLGPWGSEIRLQVLTLDVSLLGIRIRSIGALLPGQTVTLIPSEDSFHVYPCRVVWVSPSGPELYNDAGLEFVAVAKLIQRI